MSERWTIYKVDRARIWTSKINPAGLAIAVAGAVSSPGWTGFELQPAQYSAPPADGIYDLFWTGLPPGGIAPPVITPVTFEWNWVGFPEATLTGVRVHSATNVVEALLAPSSEPV